MTGTESEQLKLHLGCGLDHWSGYVNVDIDPNSKCDLVADFLDLEQHFEPNSVSEAVLIHSINYLRLWEARDFFDLMLRLLAPNGKLIIECPNIERCIERIVDSDGNFDEYLQGAGALTGFQLEHLSERIPYVPFATAWSSAHLRAELEAAGYVDVQVLDPETNEAWRDMRIEASKSVTGTYSAERVPGEPITGLPPLSRRYPPGKILVIYDSQLGHATRFARGLTHQPMFDRYGWTSTFIDYRTTTEDHLVALARTVDVVYTLKVASLPLFRRFRSETTVKVIFDLADALWQPVHRQAGWTDLEGILPLVDCIFFENGVIAEFARRYNKVYFVPLVTNAEKFDIARKQWPREGRAGIRVGWVGSTGTATAIGAVRELIRPVFLAHPEMELRIVGCEDPRYLQGLEDFRLSVLPSYNEAQMIDEIVQFDIGLFPPPSDLEDYRVRGAQKAFLYMQGGVPTIALNEGDCRHVLEDGVTGMLVNSPEEWSSKLDILASSASLRAEMGDRAAEVVRAGHTHEHVFEILQEGLWRVIYGEI